MNKRSPKAEQRRGGSVQTVAPRLFVSSSHLVSEKSGELSEFEFGLIIAGHAFDRWVVRCMAAAGIKDLTRLDVLLLAPCESSGEGEEAGRHQLHAQHRGCACRLVLAEEAHIAGLDSVGEARQGSRLFHHRKGTGIHPALSRDTRGLSGFEPERGRLRKPGTWASWRDSCAASPGCTIKPRVQRRPFEQAPGDALPPRIGPSVRAFPGSRPPDPRR